MQSIFKTTTEGPKQRIKTTPGVVGLNLYKEWKSTCTSKNPMGNGKFLSNLKSYIKKQGGYNKAGVSAHVTEIKQASELFQKQNAPATA